MDDQWRLNDISCPEEISEGRDKAQREIQNFRSMILECGLIDLVNKGVPFTWCNRRMEGVLVKEKLDRGMFNTRWLDIFPDSILL